MKKIRIMISCLLALSVLALSACGAAPAPTGTPTAQPGTAPTVEPGTAPTAMPDAGLGIDYATDEQLARFEGFEEFDEYSDPDYQRIILTAGETVTDLKYVPMTPLEGGDAVLFELGEPLYTLPELTAEKPLVIAWMEVGLFPNRGVALKDAAGAERVFAIIMSGEDGSVRLMELIKGADGAYAPATV